jgi:hypothetical protein
LCPLLPNNLYFLIPYLSPKASPSHLHHFPPPFPPLTSPLLADETSYINYIELLIFAAELNFPHVLLVIDTRAGWVYTIHLEHMVPSFKDRDLE